MVANGGGSGLKWSNFTKFEHNTSIGMAMNPFET